MLKMSSDKSRLSRRLQPKRMIRNMSPSLHKEGRNKINHHFFCPCSRPYGTVISSQSVYHFVAAYRTTAPKSEELYRQGTPSARRRTGRTHLFPRNEPSDAADDIYRNPTIIRTILAFSQQLADPRLLECRRAIPSPT
jgi:hypothetical protein